MTISRIAGFSQGSSTGDGFTTSAVDTSGSNLIVLFVYGLASTSGAISDSKSNTWHQLTEVSGFFDLRFGSIYYAENPTVGSGHTFTVSGTGNFPGISMLAFSNVKTSSAVDVSNGAGGTFVGTLQTGSITPSEDNEVLVTGMGFESSDTPTIDLSFTVDSSKHDGASGSQSFGIAYLIETTAAAKNPTWTAGNSSVAVIASFKSASAGAAFIARSIQINQAPRRASYY